MPEISIILPAYNSVDFIGQTIASICAQDFADWELVVVNDGSTDDTSAAIRGRDPRFVLIEQANAGIAAARNSGLRAARGRYIAFIDHDDYWHPQKLSAQLRAFHANPRAGIVYGQFELWNPDQAPRFPDDELDATRIDPRLSGWIYHRLLLTNWVLFSTALFRREVFDRVGWFDTQMPPADDWDMAVRASREFQFVKLAQPVTLYRQHPLQTSRIVEVRERQTEFRERALRVFGTTGPDGSKVDLRAVEERQFRAYVDHAALHRDRGDPRVAIAALNKALRLRPLDWGAWLLYLRTLGKWLTRSPKDRRMTPDERGGQ
jgi:glycosyltransferase involved in cell wall biosynthesis